MVDVHNLLEKVFSGMALTQAESQNFFDAVVNGEVDDIILSSMLTALKIKGETAVEIAGAASALVKNAASFPRPDYDFADIVGTGGDGQNTINISSAAAVVAAASGIHVAKHGNRSVSSKSGSADLFREFGLELMMPAETARKCLDESKLCFLFAPNYHAGIKHAMGVRTSLKTRTLFNLLGPLANPAKPSHILIGVYSPDLIKPFGETLQLLGYKHAMVVHGNGLDEIGLHGKTKVGEVSCEQISYYELSPEDFGLPQYPLEAIRGGEPHENKSFIEAVLNGEGELAHKHAIAANCGALLNLLGKGEGLKESTELALSVINSGSAIMTMEHCASISQSGS